MLQRRTRPDRLGQPGPALDERPAGEILPVDLQQVEDAVDDRVLGHLLGGRPAGPEALLESGEGRLVAVEGHHLAIEQEVPGGLGGHRRADLGVGGGQILAGTGLEPHCAPSLSCHAALTVELALQQPVAVEIAAIGQGGEHEGDHHPDIVSRGRRIIMRPMALSPSVRRLPFLGLYR